ncbi:SusD/RagB family nutrient-binding outer membrane lipoprotein [Spirosoma sordidisoli]|uniref:SusD/RagB family nutrient-binding outer membrane lipoprotein n=1 Tax=Spirosoma sordidisoli TaxID=2502893 RepID=A0A4Q2UN21_9BACT|nr:SusD/RagB family nutrient-binding outer membrane lipoprotein [Spirosoma sordidisoli]RYC71043.1 SusD/RagB family nutrient-binding outer membrane lipoprotein [Spirosoma sordidisoli]
MKVLKSIVFGLALLIATACDNEFEEVNTNPNVPTQVSPDLLLAGVLRNTINDQVGEAWGIGNIVVQHTAKIQFVNEDRYLWGERNGVWNSVYGNMRNVQNIIDLATAAGQNNYLGVALIWKSWLFTLATDAYGDIPYTEATQAKSGGVYAPKYDTQEAVYTGILADLAKANDLLGTSNEVLAGDILFGGGAGSIARWKKLANSLRLRALMRISGKRNVAADLQAIVADRAKFPIMESNADNAALTYQATAPNQWPLYGSRVGSFDEFRASKSLVDRLLAINDPRLPVFARPVERPSSAGKVEYVGVPNGLGDTPALNYNGGPQGVSRVGLPFACLVCSSPAPVPNVARGLVMTYAEVQFLLAEAREKNLISTGSAETYYLNGIRANMDYYKAIVPAEYGINVTPAADYFTQAGVAYTGTTQQKLEKIGTQKWVALLFNGLEGWFDWRRTGIPTVTPGPDNLNGNRVPVRYPYPQSEQALNGKNRAEAVTRQGTDDLNTAVWWDK